MNIGKTRTLADIKKNADPCVKFVDMLAAGAGTAGIRHMKTVGGNDDLRIDVKVFHFFATENTGVYGIKNHEIHEKNTNLKIQKTTPFLVHRFH